MAWWRDERVGRPQVAGAALAAAWLVVTVVADALVSGDQVVLTPLLAIAPLIACAVLPAAVTAGFAVAAVALAAVAGVWNDNWGDPRWWSGWRTSPW